MPASKSRAKRAKPLKGIPASVLRQAPAEWPTAKQALWCQIYMRGLIGRTLPHDLQTRHGTWARLAYQKGQREAWLSANNTLVVLAQAYFARREAEPERDYNTFIRKRIAALMTTPLRLDREAWGRPN